MNMRKREKPMRRDPSCTKPWCGREGRICVDCQPPGKAIVHIEDPWEAIKVMFLLFTQQYRQMGEQLKVICEAITAEDARRVEQDESIPKKT